MLTPHTHTHTGETFLATPVNSSGNAWATSLIDILSGPDPESPQALHHPRLRTTLLGTAAEAALSAETAYGETPTWLQNWSKLSRCSPIGLSPTTFRTSPGGSGQDPQGSPRGAMPSSSANVSRVGCGPAIFRQGISGHFALALCPCGGVGPRMQTRPRPRTRTCAQKLARTRSRAYLQRFLDIFVRCLGAWRDGLPRADATSRLRASTSDFLDGLGAEQKQVVGPAILPWTVIHTLWRGGHPPNTPGNAKRASAERRAGWWRGGTGEDECFCDGPSKTPPSGEKIEHAEPKAETSTLGLIRELQRMLHNVRESTSWLSG